jgi:hypothetical protein
MVNIIGTGSHREENSNCGLEVFRKLFEYFKHNVSTDSKHLKMWLFQLRPRLQRNHEPQTRAPTYNKQN